MKHYKDSNNEIFAYESDGSQDHLIPKDLTKITDTEKNKILASKEPTLTYKEKRLAEYPTTQDQLDDIYHNGIDGWKSTIKAIKDKYPKG
jgi:hypothetical protein|tara:strand:- start:200 stop:469 length:270 start_codon:yes stop_codon:yes gene_type:complete